MKHDPAPPHPLLADAARVLRVAVGVAPTYRHLPKRVTPREPLALPAALLKWYEVHPTERPVPPEVSALARAAFHQTALVAEGLGFVILHRCGDAFYFLIVATWRNENELWETVWYKDGDAMPGFAAFPRQSASLPTYCVWELGVVRREQQAWVRFLQSERDAPAATRWLDERFQGDV